MYVSCDPCQTCSFATGEWRCVNDPDPGFAEECMWGSGPDDICEPVGTCTDYGSTAKCSVEYGVTPCLDIICDTENNIKCAGETAGTCFCPSPDGGGAPEFSTYGIIAAVVIIAGIVVFLIYKKKKQAPEVK